MEPNHDIYRKEEPLRSKRRRRRGQSEVRASTSIPLPIPNPQSNAAPREDKTIRIENWGGLTPQRGHRIRPGHKKHTLWIVLVAAFGIYVIYLMASIVRGKKTESLTSEPTPAVETTANPSSSAGAVPASAPLLNMADKISDWNRVPDMLLDAQSLVDQGKMEEAVTKLERALEDTPHVSRLQIKLSQILIQTKKYDRARALLLDVLESNPEDATARMLLANVLDHQANYSAALTVAKWILETDPNSIEANEIAADAYLNTERKGLAVSHLRKIVLLQRDNPLAQNKLAATYAQMGEYVKAIQLFNEVLANNQADSMTYYNLAVCYAKMSEADQAVETLTRAMSLFGRDFVNTWLKSPDFNTIRDDSIFIALQAPDAKPAPVAPKGEPAVTTNLATETASGTPP